MADNIIRFPGFLVPGRKGCLKDGVEHSSFTFCLLVREVDAQLLRGAVEGLVKED